MRQAVRRWRHDLHSEPYTWALWAAHLVFVGESVVIARLVASIRRCGSVKEVGS